MKCNVSEGGWAQATLSAVSDFFLFLGARHLFSPSPRELLFSCRSGAQIFMSVFWHFRVCKTVLTWQSPWHLWAHNPKQVRPIELKNITIVGEEGEGHEGPGHQNVGDNGEQRVLKLSDLTEIPNLNMSRSLRIVKEIHHMTHGFGGFVRFITSNNHPQHPDSV